MANEKRLIDANALLEEIQFRRPVIDTETKIVADCVAIARRAIVNAPTVDAVELVHGRWIEKVDMVESYLADCTEVFYECSVCECANLGESPYCPNCGAKMDGDGDG